MAEQNTTINPYDFKRLQLKAYGYEVLQEMNKLRNQLEKLEQDYDLVKIRLKEVDELEKSQIKAQQVQNTNNPPVESAQESEGFAETKQDVVTLSSDQIDEETGEIKDITETNSKSKSKKGSTKVGAKTGKKKK